MLALIDGDILVYRIGFTTNDVDVGIAKWRMDELVNNCCRGANVTDYKVFINSQDKSNFRYELDPTYKANRKDAPKPLHFTALREHLIEVHGATVVHGEETDDRLGILQSTSTGTIICSIDKDLDQISGPHYNFVKGIRYEVSEIDGLRWFWAQSLIGDRTDNVRGVTGIGDKRADVALRGITTNEGFFEVVKPLYIKEYGDDAWLRKLIVNGRLLWIRKKEGEMWLPPGIEVDLSEKSESNLEKKESSSDTNKKS